MAASAFAQTSSIAPSQVPINTSNASTVPLQSYLRNNSFVNFESPHVHPLDVTSNGLLLAVNTPNNSLEVYRVASGSPVFQESIPVGLDPVTVRANPNNVNQAWVVNVISDSVSIVDLVHGIVTQTLQTGDEPADVVFASGGLALVSCAQAKTVLVFNAANPTTPTATIPINGEQPRAMVVDTSGRFVYLAIFESGNQTTAVVGGASSQFENDLVQNKSGPYKGAPAPPNTNGGAAGSAYNPAFNTQLPAPIPLSIIVKRTLVGGVVQWLDDNLTNWASLMIPTTGSIAASLPATPGNRVAGWDLPDRDVAIIDTTTNNVYYQSGLMNINMAIGVNPVTDAISVVGTDATNQIRYEPVLQGVFTRVRMATFQGYLTPNTILDLNPHIISYSNAVNTENSSYSFSSDFAAGTSSAQSIGDPRAIVWNAAGTEAYITGMGSNNVIVVSPTPTTAARTATINVGQGPTGLVLYNGNAYVLNKFDATISTISTSSNKVTATTPLYFDPTPTAIKTGRPLLYNTQLTSALGQLSCASCHVDARWDRLAWDLGNPSGVETQNVGYTTNSGNSVLYHPMKGPLLTMSLVDDMQAPFLHWRGDRPTLDNFENAYNSLMGMPIPSGQAAAVTGAQIVALRSFLATITLPPNPNRNLDNSYSTTVPIIGPNNTVSATGDANQGAAEFEANCRSCHPGHTNRGFLFIDTNTPFGAGIRNPPTWKNFYKRQGLWFQNATASNSGFGFQQDGTFDSTQNDSRDSNMMAFMMSFNGGYPYEPAGLNATNWSNNSHAAVGKQVTLSPSSPTDTTGLLVQLEALADKGVIGLVAKGGVIGSTTTHRGYLYLGNGVWQSDHLAEQDSTAFVTGTLVTTNGATITFTAVPNESAERIGIDMDSDGIPDADDAQPALPNATLTDLALTGTATSVSVYDANHTAQQAIDGNTIGYFDQNSMLHTQLGGTDDWFELDLGAGAANYAAQISTIQLFNRWDCCANRLANVYVFVSQTPFTPTTVPATLPAGVTQFFLPGVTIGGVNQGVGALAQIPMNVSGRYIRVQLSDAANPVPLQLAEVRVMGYATASFSVPATQSVTTGTAVNLSLTLNNPTPNASYTFSAVNLPPGLSINSSTGTISGQVSSTAAASYASSVTASGSVGAGSPTVTVNWSIAGSTPPFTLSTASSITLQAGTGGTTPIKITPAATFSGSVSLALTGLPISGGTSDAILTNSATNATLVIYVPAAVAAGTYPLTLTGTSGSNVETTTINLVVTAARQVAQTITFNPIAAQVVGTTLIVSATASSGLPVSFIVVPNGNCSVAGNVVTFLNTGNCGVIATQPGNASYLAAPEVGQIIVVNQ